MSIEHVSDETAVAEVMPEDRIEPGEVALCDQPAYYRQLQEFPVLERAEEIRLAKKLQAGDEAARLTFLQSNLKLVLFIAHKHVPNARYMDLDDLNTEGVLALMGAMDDFDPERGNKFSTFAYRRIWGAISKSIHNQDKSIRVSRGSEEKLAGLANREQELQKKLGRQPTDEEIAQRVGMTADELAELQAIAQALPPLDSPVGYDANGEPIKLADVVADEQAVDPEAEMLRRLGGDDDSIIRQAIRDVLDDMGERERIVIEERYDLGGVSDGKFHAEIATGLGISRETVRRLDSELVPQIAPIVRQRLRRQGLVTVAETEEPVAA